MTEEEKQHRRQSILDLIAAAALSYPKQGWDVVAEKTGFTARAIEITDSGRTNFVDAILTVDLTRFEAVEEFRNAKRIVMVPPTRKGTKTNAQTVSVKPADRPADPQPRPVVHPEQPRPAISPAARRDPDRTAEPAAVAASVGEPAGNPGLRRPVCRKAETKPVASPVPQKSLF